MPCASDVALMQGVGGLSTGGPAIALRVRCLKKAHCSEPNTEDEKMLA